MLRAVHPLWRDLKRHHRNVRSSPFHAEFELLQALTMKKVLNDAGHSRCRSGTSRSHLFASNFLREERAGKRKIARPSDLDITFRTANYRNGMSEPLDQT